MSKPYKDGTTLYEILKDGWSRMFEHEQTVNEAAQMGYTVTEEYVESIWQVFEEDMGSYFRNDPYKENDDGWIET